MLSDRSAFSTEPKRLFPGSTPTVLNACNEGALPSGSFWADCGRLLESPGRPIAVGLPLRHNRCMRLDYTLLACVTASVSALVLVAVRAAIADFRSKRWLWLLVEAIGIAGGAALLLFVYNALWFWGF